jgi:ribosomal protein L11
MRFRQRGVTFFGWLILLIPWAVVGYAGIRLAPVYLNYMKVVRALNLVESDAAGTDSPASIRITIDKHFEIDMVDYPTAKDIKVTKSATGTGWDVEASYDDEAPLFANISMHVTFDKVVHTGVKGMASQ